MDEKDKHHVLGALLTASAAAAGLWILARGRRHAHEPPKSLEEEELEAFKDLEKASPLDREAFNAALARINIVQARRKLQEYRDSNAPMTSEEEAAFLDIHKYQYDQSSKGTQAFLEATARLIAATKKSASDGLQRLDKQFPHAQKSNPVKRTRCGYCNGAGWYICPACQGIGRNKLMSSPRWTGDRLIDELKAFKYDDTCKSCKGNPEIRCTRCNGTGYM
jgi:hypothetical protein